MNLILSHQPPNAVLFARNSLHATMSSPRQAYLLRCSVEHLISAVDLVPRNEWRKVFRGPISRGRNCINDEQHAGNNGCDMRLIIRLA
jgi:hypothetical protein